MSFTVNENLDCAAGIQTVAVDFQAVANHSLTLMLDSFRAGRVGEECVPRRRSDRGGPDVSNATESDVDQRAVGDSCDTP